MINIKVENDPNVDRVNTNIEFFYNSKQFDEDKLNKFAESLKLYNDLFCIKNLKDEINNNKEESDINNIIKYLIDLGHEDICGEIISFIYNRLLVEEEVCTSNIIEKSIIKEENNIKEE